MLFARWLWPPRKRKLRKLRKQAAEKAIHLDPSKAGAEAEMNSVPVRKMRVPRPIKPAFIRKLKDSRVAIDGVIGDENQLTRLDLGMSRAAVSCLGDAKNEIHRRIQPRQLLDRGVQSRGVRAKSCQCSGRFKKCHQIVTNLIGRRHLTRHQHHDGL